jgi:hypothetical protein
MLLLAAPFSIFQNLENNVSTNFQANLAQVIRLATNVPPTHSADGAAKLRHAQRVPRQVHCLQLASIGNSTAAPWSEKISSKSTPSSSQMMSDC